MFKMKRQWKRIISTIMAALMVVTVIPSSFGSSSAAEIATPGDADQTGYVKIEAKLPESDKKGEDVTGIVYEVYKDASCKDEVGTFVLSCDGNERCVHCYIPHKYKTDIMDSTLFYRIIEEGRKMNIIHVTLSGGEPLLHKDFISFLKKCRELDLSVNVLSNLTLLTDQMIDEMKKNPLLSVQTSIYAMKPDIHDNITKVEGSLEKTLCGVKKLLNANIPIQISCPVMKQNKNDFVSVIRWGYSNNISVAVEPVIFASYDHSRDNLSNRLELVEIEDVIDRELNEGYANTIMNAAKEKEAFEN